MGKFLAVLTFITAAAAFANAQVDSSQLDDAESRFFHSIGSAGQKAAFLSVLSDDAMMFRSDPIKARDYWRGLDEPSVTLTRTNAFTDLSSNGMLGYTTGSWRSATKEKEPSFKYGEYVTIWERRVTTGFRAVLDIVTTHDQFNPGDIKKMSVTPSKIVDENKKGYSATNAAMQFLRLGMGEGSLATAYEFGSQDDVRLIVDFLPPILGKKRVMTAAKQYKSLSVPSNLAIYQSGDMAYFWHPCSYANSVEGVEKGNCLHIMKLRKKNWYVVLSVFARLENDAPPALKPKSK